jgi:Zn-dependent protease with chaperone function
VKFDPSLPKEGINVSPAHPLREALLLVAGVIGVTAVVVLAIGVVLDFAVPRIPAGLEARLFSAWFGGYRVDDADAPPREAALAEILAKLGRHTNHPPCRFRVLMVDDPLPNAIAFPGGTIAVTAGLLERVESENELAFVLGHELGHFHNRDHLRGLGTGLALSMVWIAVGLGGGGSVAEIASIAGALTQRVFGREQEMRADRFGLELLASEYGHTAGAADFFEHLSESDRGLGRKFAGYFSTHPLHADRVDALGQAARVAGWPLHGERKPLAVVLRDGAAEE